MPRKNKPKIPWGLIIPIIVFIISIVLVCAMFIVLHKAEQVNNNVPTAVDEAVAKAVDEAVAKAVEEAAAKAAEEAVTKVSEEAVAKAAEEAVTKVAEEAAAKAAEEAVTKVAEEAAAKAAEEAVKTVDEAVTNAVADAFAVENSKNGIYAGDSNATVTFYGTPSVDAPSYTYSMSVGDSSYTLSSTVELKKFYSELEGFSNEFLSSTFAYNASNYDEHEWTISLSGNVKISAVEFFTNTPNIDGLQAYWGDQATKTTRINFREPVNSVTIYNIVNGLYTHRLTLHLTDGTTINGCYSKLGE